MTDHMEDRVRQVLAQQSLIYVEEQFPIELLYVVLAPKGMYAPFEDIVMQRIIQFSERYDIPEEIRVIIPLTDYVEPYPLSKISSSYFGETGGVPSDLKTLDLRPGYVGKTFDISEKIGEGKEGSTYTIDVHPRITYHVITFLNEAYQVPQQIPAIMKKTPIYRAYNWAAYAFYRNIVAQYDAIQQGDPNTLANLKKQARDLFGDEPWREVLGKDKNYYERQIERYREALIRSYQSTENDAYIDAIGYYLGSLLSEYRLSPFYTLLYATFRAQEENLYSSPSSRLYKYGPLVNEPVPVQVVVMQPLEKTVQNMMDENVFVYRNEQGRILPRTDMVMSLMAQIIFGLAIGQAVFGIVNNDFHAHNVMYEKVDYPHLYYCHPTQQKYWCIPTFGFVYKMIDFGRATYTFGDVSFGSKESNFVYGPTFDPYGRGNDLYRFAHTSLIGLGIMKYFFRKRKYPRTYKFETPPEIQKVVEMFRHILNCDGLTAVDVGRLCDWEEGRRPDWLRETTEKFEFGSEFERCENYARFLWPFEKNTPCTNSIPNQNFHWFEEFEVDPQDIPQNETIYPVL
jgi:hypothetical protein